MLDEPGGKFYNIQRKAGIDVAYVTVKCTNCMANIELDDSLTSGTCGFCGGRVVLQEAMTKRDGIADQLAENAEVLRRLGEWNKAWDAYGKLTQDYPGDWRGWWGLFQMETDDLTKLGNYTSRYVEYALKVAGDARPRLEQALTQYFRRYADSYADHLDRLEPEILAWLDREANTPDNRIAGQSPVRQFSGKRCAGNIAVWVAVVLGIWMLMMVGLTVGNLYPPRDADGESPYSKEQVMIMVSAELALFALAGVVFHSKPVFVWRQERKARRLQHLELYKQAAVHVGSGLPYAGSGLPHWKNQLHDIGRSLSRTVQVAQAYELPEIVELSAVGERINALHARLPVA